MMVAVAAVLASLALVGAAQGQAIKAERSATMREIRGVRAGDDEWRPMSLAASTQDTPTCTDVRSSAVSTSSMCTPTRVARPFRAQVTAGGAPLLYARGRVMKLLAAAPEEDASLSPAEARQGAEQKRSAWVWRFECTSAPRPSLHAYTNPTHKRKPAPRPDSAGSTWLTTASCFPAAAVAGNDAVEHPCFRAIYDGWIRLPTTTASSMDARVVWDNRLSSGSAAFHDTSLDWGAGADASYTAQVLAILASELT